MKDAAKSIWSPSYPVDPARWPYFYGWWIAVVGTIGSIATIPGQTMGISMFMEPMMATLGILDWQMSLAYLIGTIISGLTLPFAGKLLDNYGIRKVMTLVTLGFGLMLCAMAAVAPIHSKLIVGMGLSIWVLWAIMVIFFLLLRFLGQGLLMICATNIRAKWFNRRRGIVMGVSATCISISFAFAPPVLGSLVDALGWQNSWLVLGLVTLVVFLPFFWVFVRDNPEESGLIMDGEVLPDLESKNSDLLIVHEYDQPEALRTLAFWVLTGIIAWHGLFTTGYIFFMEDVANSVGLSKLEMRNVFPKIGFVTIASSLICGYIVDKTRMKYFGILMGMTTAIAALAMPFLASTAGEWLFVITSGISGGCFVLIKTNTYPRFFGRTHLGAISGAATSILVIFSAFGPTLFSTIKWLTGSYSIVFTIGFIVPLMIGIAAFWADNPQRKLAKSEPPLT